MKIVYTFKARQDLFDIYGYIADTLLSPDAARSTADRIMDAARSLADLPERNPLYREEPWHSQGVRFIPVKNYLVFYVIDKEDAVVSILRILYAGRDIARQLEEASD